MSQSLHLTKDIINQNNKRYFPINPIFNFNKGNGYAPSIPYIKDKEIKSNIKDILMLAKAGMLVGDIQKEAHLSYYMA
jgi:hypothetical protein